MALSLGWHDICLTKGIPGRDIYLIFLKLNSIATIPGGSLFMKKNNIIRAAVSAFEQSFSCFCQNNPDCLDNLDDNNFKTITYALINAAKKAGTEGLKHYLTENDNKSKSTINFNEQKFTYKGTSSKKYLTLFGKVSVERSIYYDEIHGGEYLIPIDRALGLCKNDFATLETREMILFASSNSTPRELEELLQKASLCNPSRSAIQHIINKDGDCMEQFKDELIDNTVEQLQIPESSNAVVISIDGANVLVNEPGKKKGPKKKRPGSSKKCKKNKRDNTAVANPDIKPTSYQNAMVGSVSFYETDSENKPNRLQSIYTSRMPEEKSVEFKADMNKIIASLNEKIDCSDKTIAKVFLTDGHLMIKGYVKDNPQLEAFEHCIDFFHVAEHLSKAADILYGENTDLSQCWYSKWRERLKTDENAPQNIIRSMQGMLSRKNFSKKNAENLQREITFFKNNKNLMKYPNLIDRGLPIGSGPIEAACKVIVKQRMCRSGMRWSKEKGQHVLSIRALVKSKLWNNTWEKLKELKKAA